MVQVEIPLFEPIPTKIQKRNTQTRRIYLEEKHEERITIERMIEQKAKKNQQNILFTFPFAIVKAMFHWLVWERYRLYVLEN